MDDRESLHFILRAFGIFNGFSGPPCDNLWWRIDGEYAPFTLLLNCNDLFFWGTADCEQLTPDNIHKLDQACIDARDKNGNYDLATELFCCRIRGMRPQAAYYKYIDQSLWWLFDAAGPERMDPDGRRIG